MHELIIIIHLQLIISPNGPRQFAGVVGNREVSIATLEVAQEVGDQVADLMLKSEAKDILANAKAETAAAIIAEKQRKDAEKLRNGVKANGHQSGIIRFYQQIRENFITFSPLRTFHFNADICNSSVLDKLITDS